ncbi:unnamed protein product, partial [marine sediment metagenome]
KEMKGFSSFNFNIIGFIFECSVNKDVIFHHLLILIL